MMLHTSCNTHTVLCNNAEQCGYILQQQTIMWRWCYNKLSWCILKWNNMFTCYNHVPMYLMIWRLNKHYHDVTQQCTIMFTTDKQCYIMLQYSDNGVSMLRNIMIWCDNNVTLYNNAETCYNNVHLCSDTCTRCYHDMH